jgi:hypothetical protein
MRTSRLGKVIFAALLVATLAACSDATGPDPTFRAALARWAEHGPSSYSVKVGVWCECLGGGQVLVTVRDGIVESRHYTSDGTVVPPTDADGFPSVEGLFERVESAQREGTLFRVSYDPTLGYPTRIVINYSQAVDDEVIYEAEDLLAR